MAYRKLFICGAPRSGTTWVQNIFSSHPAVLSTGESHAFERILGPFLNGSGGEQGWAELLENFDLSREDRHVGLHLYVNRADLAGLIEEARRRPGTDVDRALQVIAGVFALFFERARRGQYQPLALESLQGSGAPARAEPPSEFLFVEKTPTNIWFADRIFQQFPEAKILEVLRDGRDVCVSLEKLAEHQDWPPRGRREQILLWKRSVLAGERLHEGPWKERVLRVRYEDLRRDTAPHIRRMFRFAGLEEGSVERIAAETDFSRMPKDPFFRRGVAGDWKDHFSDEDLRLFESLAGDVLRRAGYAAGGGREPG